MKKEIIIHIIPRIVQGGAEKLLLEICKNKKSNYQHRIIVLLDNNDKNFIKNYDIDITFLEIDSNLKLMRNLKNLSFEINKIRPKSVIYWLYHSSVISRLLKLDRLEEFAYIHNTSLTKEAKFLERFSQRALAFTIIRRNLRIIFCGSASKNFHCGKLGYSDINTYSLDNGVDLDEFTPEEERRTSYRRELGITNSQFVFGCFGRFNPQKNWPLIFRTLKEACKVDSTVVLLASGRGVSADNPEFFALLNHYGVEKNVIAVDMQSNMAKLYDAIDTLLLGSEYGEAFPLVILESMAMQKPVITYDIGATESILGNLITPIALGDERKFIDTAIKALKGNWKALTVSKQQLRARALEKFDIKKYCLNFENIIDRNN